MLSLAATAPLNLTEELNKHHDQEERFILSWGSNSHRQCLTDEAATVVPCPRLVSCRRAMRSLSAGWENSLLIDGNGNLWGGGANRGHCLSEEESNEQHLQLTRLDLSDIDGVPFEAVQVGRDHMLAILEGGRAVISWGPSNEFGQIGHGLPYRSRVRPGVVQLSGVTVKQVACGEHHSLVLTAHGEVYSFGCNLHGELGSGRRDSQEHAEKVNNHHLRGMPVRGIAAGAQSSMALSIGGQVFCWGCNGRGRLGLGPSYDQETAVLIPTSVPNLPGVARAIAAGGQHSAVILRRGRLFLAGDNRSGQLGQSRKDVDWTSTFFELPFLDYTLRVRAIALGRRHTLILSYDGELYSCGCNAEGQLGNGENLDSKPADAAPVDMPVRLNLDLDPVKEYMVVGISTCAEHTVALVIAVPEGSRRGNGKRAQVSGRPQTSASSRQQTTDFSQSMRANRAAQFLRTVNESDGAAASQSQFALLSMNQQTFSEELQVPARPSTGHATRTPVPALSSLSSGCTSKVGRSPRGVMLSVPAKPLRKGSGHSPHGDEEGTPAEEVILLQPVVQPGVAGSVGFASLTVAKLVSLMKAAELDGQSGVEELKSALTTTFSTPSLLNACFCFPGLYRPRLDAGGLLNAFKEFTENSGIFEKVEMHIVNAAFEGLGGWATDHDEATALVHRDQLRGIAALLLSPVLSDPEKPQPYELMSRIMRLVAWMPAEGRRELQEILIEDCSEEEVLRGMVRRVRSHCDETIRSAHRMQRLSPEIWEGLMLLQLLWGANESVAKRLDLSLRTQPEWPETDLDLGASLSQTLSQLTGFKSGGQGTANNILGKFALAPTMRAPVPSFEFHLASLAEELVPPELEFRLFVENACAGPITPAEVLELPLYAARTDYGFEYVLPSKMRSFMANRNLVPVSYTRKVLQVENHHAQVYLQHQVARRVAADLEVLPGHEIHIDPALLFFILKVRRDVILEDTTAALQRATPEDLRRQLKVVFEGEQGVDEGGLAREFFRLLSARVFTADCGLFDLAVAQSARVLWFDSASACESTDFWLAGVILGLVVYNNMPGLDVRFPPVIFKKIKDESLGLEDLRHVHPEIYLSLRSLLSWEPEQDLGEDEANSIFENTFCLDFVVTFDVDGKPETKELCEGGKDRTVTMKNREEFVRLYCEWLLTKSVEKQFEPFRKGVRRVCDSPLFNALHSAELEMIVCGEQELDFSQLKRNAHYDGFTEELAYIESFWKLLLSFDVVQKKRFLCFVTGSDLAPVGGLQELQLVIQRNGGEPTERLPTAHTCFNLLLLPEYGSSSKLERMVTTAMHNAEGFGLE